MQKYDSYKDSGIEWIGEIPSHWEVMPLKNLGTMNKGLTFTKADIVEEGIPAISYGQIHSKDNIGTKLNPAHIRYIPDTFALNAIVSLVQKGDFIFADTSEDLEGVGNAVYIDTDAKIYGGYHTIVFRTKNSNNKYFAYLFLTDCWRSQIRSQVYGVKVYSITQSILSTAKIIIPSKVEQDAIATFLDSKCSKIDTIVYTLQKRIELLKELKQSVITRAVTHGITPNAKMKDSGIEWIGEIPSHWEVGTFKRCMTINNGSDYKHVVAANGYPVFGSGGPFAFASDYMYDGEVVMLGRKGTIDKPIYFNGKFWAVDTMFYATPLSKTNCRFMYYMALTFPFDYYATATALPSMTQSDLGNNPIAIPPSVEQKAIAEYLDVKCTQIEKLTFSHQKRIDLLKEYKQSLITEVVTGKRKVI